MMLHLLAQVDAVAAAAPKGSGMGLSQVIAPYMTVFFAAFFVTFALTPLMRVLATRNGIVDWPDLARKNHIQPVAYLGGVAIFLGWLAGIALCFLAQRGDGTSFDDTLASAGFPLSIVIGAAAIHLTGLFDDVYGLSPRVKIGGQLIAAAALATEKVGTRLVDTSFLLIGLDLPDPVVYVLGMVALAVFVIGGCNAMNLLDGLDGLVTGVAAIAAGGFLIMAALVVLRDVDPDTPGAALQQLTDPTRIVLCLAMLGALLGFLPYNFNPATIFMGDAGSLLLGYLCVTAILLFVQAQGQSLVLITAALIVFALPIADTSLAIFRRTMAGQPIFSPDSRHIHHLLRRSGMSVKQAVLTMYGVAILFAAMGITMVALELRWRYILAVFFVLYGFIMVTAYKYSRHQTLLDQRREQEKAQHATLSNGSKMPHAGEPAAAPAADLTAPRTN